MKAGTRAALLDSLWFALWAAALFGFALSVPGCAS
jgi:hypothetical protein